MVRLFRIRVVTFVVLLYGAVVLNIGLGRGDGFLGKYFALKESKTRLEQVVDGLRGDRAGLELELEKLRSSPSYARKVLKDKYHEREEGEEMIFFED